MQPIQHRSNNDVLAPPAGASSDECRGLCITRVMYSGPRPDTVQPGVVSFWKPTPRQLELLAAGAPVWVSVMGMTHPPMALGVEGDERL